MVKAYHWKTAFVVLLTAFVGVCAWAVIETSEANQALRRLQAEESLTRTLQTRLAASQPAPSPTSPPAAQSPLIAATPNSEAQIPPASAGMASAPYGVAGDTSTNPATTADSPQGIAPQDATASPAVGSTPQVERNPDASGEHVDIPPATAGGPERPVSGATAGQTAPGGLDTARPAAVPSAGPAPGAGSSAPSAQ